MLHSWNGWNVGFTLFTISDIFLHVFLSPSAVCPQGCANGGHCSAPDTCACSPGFTGADTLENVTVTVQVPCAGNLLIPSQWFDDLNLSASVTMRKEYQNLN